MQGIDIKTLGHQDNKRVYLNLNKLFTILYYYNNIIILILSLCRTLKMSLLS
jgi:hypothetical protein